MNSKKLEPLKQWYCDDCGQLIKDPEEGWVEWWAELIDIQAEDRYHDHYREQLSQEKAEELNEEKHTKVVSTHTYRIIHHVAYTPKHPFSDCYKLSHEELRHQGQPNRPSLAADHIKNVMEQLPEWEDDKSSVIANLEEYNHFKRRLTVPYYEEAAKYIALARKDGLVTLEESYVGGTSSMIEIPHNSVPGHEEFFKNISNPPHEEFFINVSDSSLDSSLNDSELLQKIIEIGRDRYIIKK